MQRRFSRRKRPSNHKRFRVNHQIRVPEVMVIDADGSQRGAMTTQDAIALAEEQGLDLIEVSPVAQPPVCRIMNMGQWQYQQSQKQKKQKNLDTKMLRISFKIGEHDKQVRMKQTQKFLEKGHRVKIELRLKGREKAFPHKAKELVQAFVDEMGDGITVEQPVKMQGHSVSVLLVKK